MHLLSTIYIFFLSQVSHLSNIIALFGFFIFASLHTALFILLVIEKNIQLEEEMKVKSCSAGDQVCTVNLENLEERSKGCGV